MKILKVEALLNITLIQALTLILALILALTLPNTDGLIRIIH